MLWVHHNYVHWHNVFPQCICWHQGAVDGVTFWKRREWEESLKLERP